MHHYASFTSQAYRDADGPIYHTYPSLKSPADGEALWRGLVRGPISSVATDAILCSRSSR